MKKQSKLTAQDLINFFLEKPMFSRPESAKYGWPPTYGGLYTITDIYKFFEEKGFTKNDVDDVKYKYFQTNDEGKLQKGKTHYLKMIGVKNYNPDYIKSHSFGYYYYDISLEEAKKLKEIYEKESKTLMVNQIEKVKASKISISKAKEAKTKAKKKTSA